MARRILRVASVITLGLFLIVNTTKAQFQTFPETSKKSISGETIKKSTRRPSSKNTLRYLDNNKKKKKIKTSRKTVINQSCSNFQLFHSTKTARRQKAISRKRRKRS